MSQNQYIPTEIIPPLEADASLLDLSIKEKTPIPVKNLEAWEKRAHKHVAINSHAELFSSAHIYAYNKNPCRLRPFRDYLRP